MKYINTIIYSFLWGKKDKVRRSVMINYYENGGMKMPDVETIVTAAKASWNLLWK